MIGMSPGDHLSPAALPVLCPGMSPPPLQDSGFILLLPPQFPLGKDTQAQGPCQWHTGNVACSRGAGGAPHTGCTPIHPRVGSCRASLSRLTPAACWKLGCLELQPCFLAPAKKAITFCLAKIVLKTY